MDTFEETRERAHHFTETKRRGVVMEKGRRTMNPNHSQQQLEAGSRASPKSIQNKIVGSGSTTTRHHHHHHHPRRNSLVSHQSSVSGTTSHTSDDTFGRSDTSSLCLSEATTADHLSLYSVAQSPIKLTLQKGHWLAVKDVPISQNETSVTAFENGLNVKIKFGNNKRKLILRNDDRRVMAVCNRELVENGCTAYRIYACRPILWKQRPAKKTSNSKMGLYEWAEVIALPRAKSFSLNLWNGTTFVPQYLYDVRHTVVRNNKCREQEQEADSGGGGGGGTKEQIVPNECIPKAQHYVKTIDGESVLTIYEDSPETGFYTIKIQPNVDPCLMICFSTIIDDTILTEQTTTTTKPVRKPPPMRTTSRSSREQFVDGPTLQELARSMSIMNERCNAGLFDSKIEDDETTAAATAAISTLLHQGGGGGGGSVGTSRRISRRGSSNHGRAA